MKPFPFTLAFVAAISVFLLTDSAVFAESADVASFVRILQARASNFSALKGKSLPNEGSHNQIWEGKEKPFGLSCEVNYGGPEQSGYVYHCSPCTESGKCLYPESLQHFQSNIKAALRAAAPNFNWREAHEGIEFVGGRSPSETVVIALLPRGPKMEFSELMVCANPDICKDFILRN